MARRWRSTAVIWRHDFIGAALVLLARHWPRGARVLLRRQKARSLAAALVSQARHWSRGARVLLRRQKAWFLAAASVLKRCSLYQLSRTVPVNEPGKVFL